MPGPASAAPGDTRRREGVRFRRERGNPRAAPGPAEMASEKYAARSAVLLARRHERSSSAARRSVARPGVVLLKWGFGRDAAGQAGSPTVAGRVIAGDVRGRSVTSFR